jgi:uncharacterized protein (DUF1778 family)
MPKTKRKKATAQAATKMAPKTAARAKMTPRATEETTAMAMNRAAKSTRWNLRVAHGADEAVRRAASASNRNLTEFVEQAAVSEAERVLADRTRFALDREQWQSFVAYLDRPPRDNPGLSKLFAKPDVFA